MSPYKIPYPIICTCLPIPIPHTYMSPYKLMITPYPVLICLPIG